MIEFSKAAGVAVWLIIGATAVAAQDSVTVKYATFVPEQSLTNRAIVVPFLERVKADSEGTFDYEIFAGGTLGRSPAQQLKLVQDGIADMAFVIPSYYPGVFDVYNVSQLPTLAETAEQGSVGLWEAYAAGLLPEPDGAVVLGLFANAPNMVHLSGEADGLSAIGGRNLRVAGEVQGLVVEELGGSAVGNIGAPGIAEAISRNVVSGALLDWAAVRTFRVDKVTQTHIEMPLGMVGIMIPMNRDTYDSLPEPARKALDKHMGRPFSQAAGRAFDKAVVDAKTALLAEPGQILIEPDDAEKGAIMDRMAGIVDAWIGDSEQRRTLVETYRTAVRSLQ